MRGGGQALKKHMAAVLGAGCLWGTMGFFSRSFSAIGIGSGGTIFLRCAVAALLFLLTILLKDPAQLRVKPRDFWCFFGSGICSLLFFTYCYFTAISLMSLSAAAILLYTAPAIVVLLSALLFHERMTLRKLSALLLAVVGCALVSGLGSGTVITVRGLLYGLGAGAGYALYSIFARFALDRGYSSGTVNFYSCLLAAVGSALLWGVKTPLAVALASGGHLAFSLCAGVVTCYLPYLLYTYGLSGLETGRASILASVEPVVATLLGVLIYREKLTLLSAGGILCVLAAVLLLNARERKKAPL